MMREEADTFAAAGLAEGGDVEGATELMERPKQKKA